MSFDPLIDEVEELHGVCVRREQLAAEHTIVSTELLAVASSIRNSAMLLGVMIATKLHHRDGHHGHV